MTPFEKAARDHASSRAATGTRYLYQLDLDRWLAHCAKNGADPARPTLELAIAFRAELEGHQKPQTVRRTLTTLSRIYRSAMAHESPLARWNPFEADSLPRPPADAYTRTEAFTAAEAKALIATAATDRRELAVLLLLYETGLRRASIAALKRADLFRRGGKMMLHVIIKGNKRREVEVPERAAAALLDWIGTSEPSAYVFPSTRHRMRDRPLDPRVIGKIVARVAARAGVKHDHPHRFRASYATAALDAGIPLHEVQASLHHSSPDTTLRYDRGKRGTGVSEAVAKLRSGRS